MFHLIEGQYLQEHSSRQLSYRGLDGTQAATVPQKSLSACQILVLRRQTRLSALRCQSSGAACDYSARDGKKHPPWKGFG